MLEKPGKTWIPSYTKFCFLDKVVISETLTASGNSQLISDKPRKEQVRFSLISSDLFNNLEKLELTRTFTCAHLTELGRAW